jgi:hypothetical protein
MFYFGFRQTSLFRSLVFYMLTGAGIILLEEGTDLVLLPIFSLKLFVMYVGFELFLFLVFGVMLWFLGDDMRKNLPSGE